MTFTQDFELIIGVMLVALVLHDVFQSVVVPRWSSRRGRIAPLFIDRLWPLWRSMAARKPQGDGREDFLGTYAPLALMLTLALWVGFLLCGFGLIFWGLRYRFDPGIHSYGEATYVAGVTLLTIGYGDYTPSDFLSRAFVLFAGASGLAVFALVISLLFTLYTAFERREVLCLALDARAGSPPSGVALLEAYSHLELLDTLPSFFEQWERWSAQVLQSHIAYPLLAFFRSSHDNQSWIAGLGAVLDGATLLITTVAPCEKVRAQTNRRGAFDVSHGQPHRRRFVALVRFSLRRRRGRARGRRTRRMGTGAPAIAKRRFRATPRRPSVARFPKASRAIRGGIKRNGQAFGRAARALGRRPLDDRSQTSRALRRQRPAQKKRREVAAFFMFSIYP